MGAVSAPPGLQGGADAASQEEEEALEEEELLVGGRIAMVSEFQDQMWGWIRLVLVSGLALGITGGFPGATALPVPELTGPVVDLTGILTDEDRAGLDFQLQEHREQTGQQFGILMIPSLEGAVLESFSMSVVEKWQLGSDEKDDGLLILLAMDDRKMRIEVGYGLEGAIPDAFAKRVTSDILKPAFRKGEFAAGLGEAVNALRAAARGDAPTFPEPTSSEEELGDMGFFLIVFFALVFFALRSMFRSVRTGTGSGVASSGSSFSSSFSSSSSSSWDDGYCGGGGDFGGGGASDDW